MIMQSTNSSTSFIQAGDRLSHILDNIGFIGGRGRIKHFFELLISRADYNYTKIKKIYCSGLVLSKCSFTAQD